MIDQKSVVNPKYGNAVTVSGTNTESMWLSDGILIDEKSIVNPKHCVDVVLLQGVLFTDIFLHKYS
jgi:hypothetical protein